MSNPAGGPSDRKEHDGEAPGKAERRAERHEPGIDRRRWAALLGEGLRYYAPIAERSDVAASDPSLSRAI